MTQEKIQSNRRNIVIFLKYISFSIIVAYFLRIFSSTPCMSASYIIDIVQNIYLDYNGIFLCIIQSIEIILKIILILSNL